MKKVFKLKFLCPIISIILIILNLVRLVDTTVLINSSPINSYLIYIKHFKLDNFQMLKSVIYIIHIITFILYGYLLDLILRLTKIVNKQNV